MSVRPSVFISYASQDREAARSIRDALLAAGIEAWYDENELGGGDVWDQKIRRQIRECVYFMPIISTNTEARVEGYFRREWRLAAERTLDMADDVAFLIPLVIDQTPQEHARVPEKFLASQWMKVPGGQPTPAFNAWCARVMSNEPPPLPRSARVAPPLAAAAVRSGKPPPLAFPPFPHQVEGQSIKFGADIVAWFAHTTYVAYKHCPKWLRWVICIWLVIIFFKACSSDSRVETRTSSHRSAAGPSTPPPTPEQISRAQAVAKKLAGTTNVNELVRKLTKEFGDDQAADPALFLVAFTAPKDDPAATELANSVFAALYGGLSLEQPTRIALDRDASSTAAPAAELERASDQDAHYLLTGAVGGEGAAKALTVTVRNVPKNEVFWTHAYPAATAVATDIARDIRAHLPPLSSAP